MGDFKGHFLPGFAISFFGFWWAWSILHRYYACYIENLYEDRRVSKRENKVRYTSTISFPLSTCRTRLPIEGICLVTFTALGIIGEIIALGVKSNFMGLVQPQHMLMHSFFLMCGIIIILAHYKFPLPKDSDYAMGLLAFIMEGFLFTFHLHKRTVLDAQAHMFLVYAIVGTVIGGALEMRYRHNVLAALCRCYCTLLQGTWMIVAGFLLYPLNGNAWDQESNESLMKSTIVFGFNNITIVLFLGFLATWIFFRVSKMSEPARKRILISIADPPSLRHLSDVEDRHNLLIAEEQEEMMTSH